VAAIVHYTTGDRAKAKDEAARAKAIDPTIQLPAELIQLLQGG
jgi:hypothetical protein